MAKRYAALSGIPLLIGALFLFAFVDQHIKHGFNHGAFAATFVGVITFGLPAALGLWLVFKARRVTRVGRLATSDRSLTWHLTDHVIIVGDTRGVPHPELAFSVSRKVRQSLVSLPRATAVASDSSSSATHL